jgi:small-conductance mechanosensitive channel
MSGVSDRGRGGREALSMRGRVRVWDVGVVAATWASQIVEAPHVVRVEAFKDSGVALKVMGVTRPVRQWEVMGELRRRLKKAFDAESIELRW